MERLNVKRANRLMAMLFNEWKVLDNDGRPQKIEWNIMHMYSSAQLATLYAKKNNLDIELCALIAILHDIAVVDGKIKEDHDKLAEEYVVETIRRYNDEIRGHLDPITQNESQIIIEAVTVHSDKETYTDNIYAEMLKNIDSFDRYLHGIRTEGAHEERTIKMLEEFFCM